MTGKYDKRLAALENVTAPVQFTPITEDMDLKQAQKVYSENLRVVAERRQPDTSAFDSMTLDESIRIYNEQLEMTSQL